MPNNRNPRRSIGVALGVCLACASAIVASPAVAEPATVDLGVAQSDSPDPVARGQVLTYSIQVGNRGPDAASHVQVVDTLSSRVNFLSASSPRARCGRSGPRVVCSLGTLAARELTTITIRVSPALDRERYRIVNVVSVGRRKTDRRPANNTVKEATTVVSPPPVICSGRRATIVGTDGGDALVGTEGRDVIAALSGDDDILGVGGADIVCGSGGDDTVRGGGGGDLIKGGGGNDDLGGGDDSDLLFGKGGRDRLDGGRGGDALRGGSGRDRCRGGGADSKRSC